MSRLLLLLLLVALAVIAWRVLRGARTPPAGDAPKFEPTARCANCGTHVPRDQLDDGGACPRCRASPN
ncbi:MAG: hypothetical protein ACT4PK_01920 [Gammaproteobacteria bacterium]